ncbi:MAG TPA: pilus assembly protein TadG-related protein [Acidimicrobiales bacterium]|jgi:uncharacterized membrane protein
MNINNRLVSGRARDERGATLILVGLSMVILIAACALAVDVGRVVVANRSLQTVADAGALDAARYVNIAGADLTAQAERGATENSSSATVTAVGGIWNGAGFTPGATPFNAVKVIAATTQGHLFAGGSSALSRMAIASVNPEAGFSIGTFLASLSTQQSAVLNLLLGNLGTSVSLTAVGYTGLANTNVTVQQLIDASSGLLTPSNVLTTSLTGTQWVSFLNAAVTSQAASLTCGGSSPPYPCTAEANLTTLSHSVNASTSARLCDIVSINGSSCTGGPISQNALSASLNVLQTLTTDVYAATGTTALNVNTALNLGVASASLVLSLIHIPEIAYGPIGTTATTGQVNADLQIKLLGSLEALDIQITAADGTATLSGITCSSNTMTSTQITASTTAVTLPVTLLGLPIATAVTGVNNASLNYAGSVVPPTTATVAARTNPQTVGTDSPSLSFTGLNLVNSLLVGPLLNSVLAPILGPTLQALGVSLAGADVADLSTNCGSVSLVK